MLWLALALTVLGGGVALINFYLSFVARPLHRWRFGSDPAYVPSGFPLVGFVVLVAAALLSPSGALALVAGALAILDTGGPHWFVLALLRR